MFKQLILAAILATASLSVLAEPVTYKLDPAHTIVIAQWNHFGFSNPSAHFGDADGTLVYDADNVAASSVEVTLPLSSMNSFTAKFDEHLRSSDFFDVAAFPVATFKSTAVEAVGNGRLKVSGQLTIKGVSQPVVLDVTLNKAGKNMSGQPTIGFDATTTILRSDFDVGMYAPSVSDAVDIRITTEAYAPKPAEAG